MTGANLATSFYIIPKLRKSLSRSVPVRLFGAYYQYFNLVVEGLFMPAHFGPSLGAIILAPTGLVRTLVVGAFCFGMLTQVPLTSYWIMPTSAIIQKT